MGRTLPSYRRMLEKERSIWEKHYADRLREPYRTSFILLWQMAFQLADASSTNTRPIILDNILMSMLVAQQTELSQLKEEIVRLRDKISQMVD
ncbi:MAG: hypothetical protein ACFFBD_29335 [Candidatus Hodarchaeota archaeon]